LGAQINVATAANHSDFTIPFNILPFPGAGSLSQKSSHHCLAVDAQSMLETEIDYISLL
jgi:hypothetical protein